MTTTPHFIRTFIDTEFTDLVDMGLISVALVAVDGEEFYAEVDDFPREQCNDFVRKNVLPRLGEAPGAVMSQAELRDRLLAWLCDIRGTREFVVVSFDYFGDWALFTEALGDVPKWIRPDSIRDRIDEGHRAHFFKIAVGKRHHALWDARALCAAYLARQGE